MRFGVLGPLEVWTAQGRQIRVPELKVRTLLADLLVHHGHVVSTGQLIEDLWGGSTFTAQPASSLQAKVSQLRRALENAEPGARSLVLHRPPGYLLDVPADALDLGRFRALVTEARACDVPRTRAALLTDALALWRGPAFADFAGLPFAGPAAVSLEEERLRVVEEHADARLALGEHGALLGELAALVGRFPLREGLRAAQMRALYLADRPTDALDSFAEFRRTLDEELGLTPGPALVELQRAILRHDPHLARREPGPAAVVTVARARTNLSAPAGTLIGRGDALAEVRRLLTERRLVTLTGPGGVGKTRMAVAAAEGAAAEFPDGVWLVELARTDADDSPMDQRDLAELVLGVLGIRESVPDDRADDPVRRLAGVLAAQRVLLVLDNCEHVLDAVVRLVGPLLDGVPGLHVLTTSQEPLRITREAVWPVLPLELPPPGQDGVEELRASSAVRLFAERAAAGDPAFVLDDTTAPMIAEMCRRLDGLPLALELAATRVRALGVRELHDRLDDRFRLLTGGYRDAPRRHRTLQATIDWSWSLLDPREQAVLRRLAVFADGCCLEAAEEVCAGGAVERTDVLDILAALVDRSLVLRVEGAGSARYRLLESVAVYAQQKLRESGEATGIAARQLGHFTELAERARPHLHGRDQYRWLRRLDAESANFQRALEEARRTGFAATAVRLANALSWYRFLRGRLGEGRKALADALNTPGDVAPAALAEARAWHTGFTLLLGEPGRVAGHTGPDAGCPHDRAEQTVERARAEWFLGFAQWTVGALSAGERSVQRALRDFRVLRDPWGTAAALSSRAALALGRGDLAALHGNALEAHDHFVELGENWGKLKATETLSVLAEINGDYERATELHGEGLRIAETLELWSEVSRQMSGLGRIALLRNRYREAEDFHARALRLAVEQGNRPAEQFAAVGLALGSRREGRLEEAESLLRPWLAWNRSRHDAPGLALVLAELGFIAEQRGDGPAALILHLDGLAAARAAGDPRSVALALEGVAGACSLTARPHEAARLLGTATATRLRSGAPQPPAEQGDVERISARLRERLGAQTYAAEFAAGESLDHTEALVPGAYPL
ncbi:MULTISPECIES: BTAD domain-containing putative transcriptional regulator [unclassified Streptomyces]|uniref:BTAD domain-containing putative transcriptional regulator n=1 Tax=unclassified Streptomyces TaxID=2593676 RepID=UPI00344FEAC6